MSLINKTNELVAGLASATTLLDGVFSNRARSFVDVGERLVEAVFIFHDLTSIFDALAAGLANEELRSAADTLDRVARECTAIHDIIPDQVSAMTALATANITIGKRLDMLRNNIQTIANIAINARIEVSALKSDSQDMLTFTYEVSKLAATAEVTVNQYGLEQRNAHEALHAARAALITFETRHRAQLGSIAKELRRSLEAVDGRHTDASNQSAQIGRRSQHIAQSIGTIITALQIADITSQRLAHVHEAVEQLLHGSKLADSGDGWWRGLSDDERGAVIAEVASLQLAQIDSSLADLRSESRSIASAIEELGREVVEMSAQGRAIYGSDGRSAESFLDELAGRITVAGQLLSTCRNACELVDELNESVGARFGALHDQAASLEGIVGIVRSVRLIGLNAHLKSDGLGPEGRTLNAISRELRNSAESISIDARDLINAIDETIALFEALKMLTSVFGIERLTALDTGMNSALAAFEDSGAKLAFALNALRTRSDKVKDVLTLASQRLADRDELETRLAEASAILRTIAEAPAKSLGTPRSKERTQSHFAHRYTMAAERNVHSVSTSNKQNNNTSALDHPSANAELEDIFF